MAEIDENSLYSTTIEWGIMTLRVMTRESESSSEGLGVRVRSQETSDSFHPYSHFHFSNPESRDQQQQQQLTTSLTLSTYRVNKRFREKEIRLALRGLDKIKIMNKENVESLKTRRRRDA